MQSSKLPALNTHCPYRLLNVELKASSPFWVLIQFLEFQCQNVVKYAVQQSLLNASNQQAVAKPDPPVILATKCTKLTNGVQSNDLLAQIPHAVHNNTPQNGTKIPTVNTFTKPKTPLQSS